MKLRNKKTGEIKEFALFDGTELQGGATLESLTKEWADYNPELIGEGKKIRKALRAWAEANGVKAIRVVSVNKTLLRFTGIGREQHYYIDIEFTVDSTDRYEDSCDGEYRSLAELFGEEEE